MNQFSVASRSSFALLVTTALLVGCGTSRPGGSPGGSATPPAGTGATTQLEAEGATTVTLPQQEIQAMTVVNPGAPSGGKVISDAGASGGQAVKLLSNGNAVRFTVPSGLGAGRYTVRVQGRADLYQGGPVVSLRVNGTERGRVELSSATYAAFTAGTFDLKAGDTIDVTLVNDLYDGDGKDRNAIIDYLMIDPAGTATTSSPAVAAPSGAVDVKSFGARGDGSTDDTDALRRAAASGKSLYFPSGTYRVRRVISFQNLNGQTITGQNATLKQDSNFTRDGDNAVLFLKNSSNVTIQGLTVIGNRTSSTPSSIDIDGVKVADSSSVTLRAMNVSRATTNGITVRDTNGLVIENTTVAQSNHHGIWIWRGRNTRLSGNTVNDSGIGILATAGDGFTAENNRISGTSDTGTKTEGVNNVVYRGNTVSNFGKDGIKVMPHTASGVTVIRNAVIENNTVSGFRGLTYDATSNILVHSTLGGRVVGNTVTGSGGTTGSPEEDGIRINAYGGYTRSRDIEVRNNTLRNVKTGLRLISDNITVTGNRVQAVGYAALLEGVGLSLTNNPEIRGGAGITVLYTTGAQGDVIGNSLFGNDLAIYAANSGNRGRISGNTFASTYRNRVVAGSGVSYTP
ncbi:right-handed parallel beta-helix repeat-containing protein [Deinococcus planocerae]|uniref:right-handed parallel beta-helix repeat-containing protein n=1 Tax=Deinococcus planocerae TaxID=1737569 RepID=UPI000C7F0E47|nr:right-handed parallel beta-helix repeat-containing protein [Deinococcus planocerae]